MEGGAPNPEDYSAAATLIQFPRPLPLLRGPIKAGPLDDPSSGPYLLAFKNRHAWAAAYQYCRSKIIAQCEAGARVGCSISASSKCKPPWWKVVSGMYSAEDFREREKCEEVEMEACFAAAKERCGGFAKQKCEPAFRNARVDASGVESKDACRLISSVCFANERIYGVGLWDFGKSWSEFRGRCEVTTSVMGNELLGSDYADIGEYLRKNNKTSVCGVYFCCRILFMKLRGSLKHEVGATQM